MAALEEETMSGADGNENNHVVWFLYTGQPNSEIPRDVTHVRIDPSVKEIAADAFRDCLQLAVVSIGGGGALWRIGERAFYSCRLLKRFKVPYTVKKIGDRAFHGCSQLEAVELCEGLEETGESAFHFCESLKLLKVPSTVEFIGECSFSECGQLEEVEFCEGLEKCLEKLDVVHLPGANLSNASKYLPQ